MEQNIQKGKVIDIGNMKFIRVDTVKSMFPIVM
ncbi:MAG: hypothetical protein ACJAUH_000147 [Saprospiraceae bacterium]|jgi:hypothetical protein